MKSLVLGLALVWCGSLFAADGEIDFATWNIGHFSCGRSSQPTLSDEAAEEMAAKYRLFIDYAGVDIMGLAEYSPYFTKTGKKRTAGTLFADWLIALEGTRRGGMCNALFLREGAVTETREREYAHRVRLAYYKFARVRLNGVVFCLVETTLEQTDSAEPSHQSDRIKQIQTLIEDFKDEPYVILGGDFQIQRKKGDTADCWQEYALFEKAGWTLAHHGEMKTAYTRTAGKPKLPLDNIIVKGFDIRNVRVQSDPALSDHALLRATLVAKPKK
ncbi:MAG: hypothetical protein J6Z49_04530 [Kiritimatiellae bacterium]|nr:hypothetical protein [Kiritimatiellia bacterium]